MYFARKTLLCGVLSLALAAPAFADTLGASTPVNTAVVAMKDGRTAVVPITAARQAELLASPHAKQLETGVVVLVNGGKTYVIEDHMMPNGKPMIAAILSDFTPSQGGG